MPLNTQQLELLHRLGRSPDGRELVTLIETVWIVEANEKLRGAMGETLYREQGRAKMLDDLVAYLTLKPPADVRQVKPTFQSARDVIA